MTAPTIRRLASLDATMLGLMHGPAFNGNTGEALEGLAAYYESTLLGSLNGAPA